jgi:hypothetical protein
MTQEDFNRYAHIWLTSHEEYLNAVIDEVRAWPKLTADEKAAIIGALQQCPPWYCWQRLPFLYAPEGHSAVVLK